MQKETKTAVIMLKKPYLSYQSPISTVRGKGQQVTKLLILMEEGLSIRKLFYPTHYGGIDLF